VCKGHRYRGGALHAPVPSEDAVSDGGVVKIDEADFVEHEPARRELGILADLMREHDAVAAMVQEAVRPQSFPEGLQILGDPSLGDVAGSGRREM
jgi:hypothetical protein